MKIRAYILLLSTAFGISISYAQTEHPYALLKKIRKANQSERIAYEYTILLKTSNNQTEDSINGCIYKDGLRYKDSSNVSVKALGSEYYFSLDKDHEKITIIKLDLLEEALGLSLDKDAGNIISIPDSVLLKYGNIKIDILETGNYFIKISMKDYSGQEFELEIDRNNLLVKWIKIVMPDELSQRSGSEYSQVYLIRNIAHDFDHSALDMHKYYRVNDDTVVVNPEYAHYKINTITD